MRNKYPKTEKELKTYFQEIFLKGGVKATRLYSAAMAACGDCPSDSDYDEIDAALRKSCKGLMTFADSEEGCWLNEGEFYFWILEAVYSVANRAKLTFHF